MNRFGRNGPLVLKTYGKHSRRVEAWLSPDIRKNVFSSTSSSDLSIGEPVGLKSGSKRKRVLSTASSRPVRAAKKRALTQLREKHSDEENVFNPEPEQSIRLDRKRRGTLSVNAFPKWKKWKRLVTENSSESEEETAAKSQTTSSALGERRRCTNTGSDQHLKSASTVALPSYLGKFVTDRRREPPEKPKAPQHKRVKTKPSTSASDRSLNSSDDFVQSRRRPARFADRRRKRPSQNLELRSENTSSEMVCPTPNLSRARNLLKEATLNSTADRHLESGYKKPLLSSTPSLTSRACYRHHEPSISEISCSNDELEDAFKSSMEATRNLVSPRQRELKVLLERSLEMEANPGGQNRVTVDQHSMELFSNIDSEVYGQNRAEKMKNSPSLENLSAQSSRDSNFMSAQTHLDSVAALLKERGTAVVVLDKSDISKYLTNKGDEREEETYSSCMDSESALRGSQSDSKSGAGVEAPRGSETSETSMSGGRSGAGREVEDAGQSQENDERRGDESSSEECDESASVVYISSSGPLEHGGHEHPGGAERDSPAQTMLKGPVRTRVPEPPPAITARTCAQSRLK
ncbi:hypothetical protein AAFF_G00413690 [Aldrovandia affinis]|uniref:Uncharacterized protein n=1 Tax=Aldrovandia affinis TaxID=143900 RepID=A0AAD7SB28_9TELE|nr:hypothetical protein AAFF_G00413690 [Aldrovandia affinis]